MQGARAEIKVGRLAGTVMDGDLRSLVFAGREVLRRVSYPVRDANWGTVPVITMREGVSSDSYVRDFCTDNGAILGTFTLTAERDTLLRLSARFHVKRESVVNRVGFTVLHPLAGVAGRGLNVTRPDGSRVETRFPEYISADQPARDIAKLEHEVAGVSVMLDFVGEVFEMEDQRNWSDASFKTYCRPLAAPRPFTLFPGDEITQEIVLQLNEMQGAPAVSGEPSSGRCRLPQVVIAHEAGLSSAAALKGFPGVPVLYRLDAATPQGDLAAMAAKPIVALEIVFEDLDDLYRQIARVQSARLTPVRIVALPRSYLASHQPEGPWPAGATPRDAIKPLRNAFPTVPVGSGSLANFTEFNRCPPNASADFITFGTTAIVHAADDLSVYETLEALPAIFASAQALAPGKPLHLGLFSIGMRSNPYGGSIVPNPRNDRLPMAMNDPRQTTDFAAVHALGVLIAAARAGVDSIALAMPDGPLGAEGAPLGDLIRATASAAGQTVIWEQEGRRMRLYGNGLDLASDGDTVRGIAR